MGFTFWGMWVTVLLTTRVFLRFFLHFYSNSRHFFTAQIMTTVMNYKNAKPWIFLRIYTQQYN